MMQPPMSKACCRAANRFPRQKKGPPRRARGGLLSPGGLDGAHRAAAAQRIGDVEVAGRGGILRHVEQ